MLRKLKIAVIVVVIILLGWFVWPTPYRYDHTGPRQDLIRINRFTGATRILYPEGWVEVPSREKTSTSPNIPPEPTIY